LHWENATLFWPEAKIPRPYPDKKDPNFAHFREGAKPVMYAIAYGHPNDRGESYTKEVYKQLKAVFPDLQESFMKLLVERYYSAHPEIGQWQNENKRVIREEGKFTLPSTGDFLYLPDSLRGFNQAGNFQMQSGLGAIVNRGLISAAPQIEGMADFLGQVHDELDAQVLERHMDEVDEIVSKELSEPILMGKIMGSVPFSGDAGPNWADVKEWKK
jgi:DNA polymerase I-like protein with 3'-5' exonuclease and polymerase domains